MTGKFEPTEIPGVGERPREIPEYSLEQGIAEATRRIKEISSGHQRAVVSAIAGGTSSGKSEHIAERIRAQLPEAELLKMDDYYHDAEFMAQHPELNWDQPEAVDLDLFIRHVEDLKRGVAIQKPVYSFVENRRTGTVAFAPAKVILIEGLFALNQRVAPHADFKIFVDSGAHGRFLRKLIRDVDGGRKAMSLRDVFRYYFGHANPMHDAHIAPTKLNADMVINNEFDPQHELQKSARYELQYKYEASVSEEQLVALGAIPVTDTRQQDTYFMPKDRRIANWGERMILREEHGRYQLSYKRPVQLAQTIVRPHLDIPIEPEDIPLVEGEYQKIGTVSKQRKEYRLGSVDIALDTVDGLGAYIELRSTSSQDEDELQRIANALGLAEAQATDKSYFELLEERRTS